jgi:hypothetical protein
MPGVFDLRSPADLLAKLGRELERLRAAPNDVDHAFNFFVTAEHMLDWRYPDPNGKTLRKAKRDSEPLLQLVSHLASGAKHFDNLNEHHQSVADTGLKHRHPNPMMRRMMPSQLCVIAIGDAGAALGGSRITALALAEKVYAYWQTA